MYLWIDPWIRKLWFAIIDKQKKIWEIWTILTEKEDNTTRIYNIWIFIEKLLSKYNIKNACVEKLFFTKYNKANAEFVYEIRWVVLFLLKKYNINIIQLTPLELKKIITWNWKASKIVIQNSIAKIFNLQSIPKPADSADALGMAYVAMIKKGYKSCSTTTTQSSPNSKSL